MRKQPQLPEDHPLQDYASPPTADCIAEVPPSLLAELEQYYEGQEPEGEPIPEGEELV